MCNCPSTTFDHSSGVGGGIYSSYYVQPTLTRCTFNGNSASSFGGGMVNSNNSHASLTDCSFDSNSAVTEGGAMYNWRSSPTLNDCVFRGNTAGTQGGAIIIYEDGSPTFTRCTLADNAAGLIGGAIYCYDNCWPTLTDCEITGNTACDWAGGIYSSNYSNPRLNNCMISSNSASFGGAMFCFNWGHATLINCTAVNNMAELGPMLGCDSSYQMYPNNVVMANCILWNGTDQIWNNDGSTLTFTYCNIQGGWTGTGNIDFDPLFVDPMNDDYHLRAGSPCIDAGDNDAVPIDITSDLDGNPRFVDDPGRYDTGHGTPPLVDIGCYEFQGDSAYISVLTVSPDPLIAGQGGVFTTVNATPNTKTYLAYSLRGLGSTFVPFLNVTLDLNKPKQAGDSETTDAGGNVTWNLPIPLNAAGRNAWLQACQYELKTNVVATSIVE